MIVILIGVVTFIVAELLASVVLARFCGANHTDTPPAAGDHLP